MDFQWGMDESSSMKSWLLEERCLGVIALPSTIIQMHLYILLGGGKKKGLC
jgi:hypothetical protein